MEYAAETEFRRRFDWYSLIAALIMIIIGVTILIAPDETGTILVYVVGALVTAAGIVSAAATLMAFLGAALSVQGLLMIVSLCLFHKKV